MARRREELRLNQRGLLAALKLIVPDLERVAREIQAHVPAGYEVGVLIENDRTGRPVAMVAIMEPWGLAAQAKHGILTRAAAAAGLDVHRYPIEGA